MNRAESPLFTGSIPSHWRKYKVHAATSLAQFVPNFAQRLKQLETVGSAPAFESATVNLGLLFFPGEPLRTAYGSVMAS